jgi:uncharacterized membrane protein
MALGIVGYAFDRHKGDLEPQRSSTMSDLVAIAFPAEAKAEEVRQKLVTMQKKHLIDLGDAVIALKESDGYIKLNRLINTTATGAVSGAFWGALIDDKWMKETAANIKPGTAALFALVRKFTANKVLDALGGEGGTVLKTSLDHTTEAALQAALAGGPADRHCRRITSGA